MRTGLILALALLASGDARACGQEWTKRPIHMGGGIFEMAGCSDQPTEHVCIAVVSEEDELRGPGLPWTGGWIVTIGIQDAAGVVKTNVYANDFVGNARTIEFDSATDDCASCHKVGGQPECAAEGPYGCGFEWRSKRNIHSRAPDGSACQDEVHWLESSPRGFGSAHTQPPGIVCWDVVCGDVVNADILGSCQFPAPNVPWIGGAESNHAPGCTHGWYISSQWHSSVSERFRYLPDADVNRDEVVGTPDVLAVAVCFGQPASCNVRADTDANGVIGVADYLNVSQNFGRSIIEWTSPMGHAMRRYSDLGPCQDGTYTCGAYPWPTSADISFEPDSGFHDVAEPFDQ